MVTEHRSRGFPEEWLSRTFGLCAVVNGATAIVAGIVAQVSADVLGDIGPFRVAIALTMLAGVLILPWAENYGDQGDTGAAQEELAGLGAPPIARGVEGGGEMGDREWERRHGGRARVSGQACRWRACRWAGLPMEGLPVEGRWGWRGSGSNPPRRAARRLPSPLATCPRHLLT